MDPSGFVSQIVELHRVLREQLVLAPVEGRAEFCGTPVAEVLLHAFLAPDRDPRRERPAVTNLPDRLVNEFAGSQELPEGVAALLSSAHSLSRTVPTLRNATARFVGRGEGPKSQPKAEPQLETRQERKPESVPELKPKPETRRAKPESKPRQKIEAKLEPNPELKPKPETRHAKPESKPKQKIESKPEPMPELILEPKPDSRPAPTLEPKITATPEYLPESKQDAIYEPVQEQQRAPALESEPVRTVSSVTASRTRRQRPEISLLATPAVALPPPEIKENTKIPDHVQVQVIPTPKRRTEKAVTAPEEAVVAEESRPLKVIRRRREEAPKVIETEPKPFPHVILEGMGIPVAPED
jgi:hypothetical protein